MRTNNLFFHAIFIVALTVASPVTLAEEIEATTATTPAHAIPQAPYSPKLAQNSDCDEARNAADKCWVNWKNIGGGSSGQAGSFRDCVQLYCKLLQSHGCNQPRQAQCQ